MEKNQKENEKGKEQKIDFLVDFAYRGTENLSPKERELVVYARLEEMGFEAPKEVEEEVEEAKKSGWLGKYLFWAGLVATGGGAGYFAGNDFEFPEKTKPKTEEVKTVTIQPIQSKPAVDPKKTADYEKAREAMRRFDAVTYEKLSGNGKKVYDFVRENDPTPGRSYFILDKTRATLYEINPSNKLIISGPAVFGSHLGENQNTSAEFKEGIRTTPAGVYVMSKHAGLTSKDAAWQKGKRFGLFGISILGDKVRLALHLTYPMEFEKRTAALEKLAGGKAINPRREAALSDGCINWPEGHIKRYVLPYIKGDGFELFYILPDKDPQTGKEPVFDPKGIIGKIKPVMVDVQKIERESI